MSFYQYYQNNCINDVDGVSSVIHHTKSCVSHYSCPKDGIFYRILYIYIYYSMRGVFFCGELLMLTVPRRDSGDGPMDSAIVNETPGSLLRDSISCYERALKMAHDNR